MTETMALAMMVSVKPEIMEIWTKLPLLFS